MRHFATREMRLSKTCRNCEPIKPLAGQGNGPAGSEIVRRDSRNCLVVAREVALLYGNGMRLVLRTRRSNALTASPGADGLSGFILASWEECPLAPQ